MSFQSASCIRPINSSHKGQCSRQTCKCGEDLRYVKGTIGANEGRIYVCGDAKGWQGMSTAHSM